MHLGPNLPLTPYILHQQQLHNKLHHPVHDKTWWAVKTKMHERKPQSRQNDNNLILANRLNERNLFLSQRSPAYSPPRPRRGRSPDYEASRRDTSRCSGSRMLSLNEKHAGPGQGGQGRHQLRKTRLGGTSMRRRIVESHRLVGLQCQPSTAGVWGK